MTVTALVLVQNLSSEDRSSPASQLPDLSLDTGLSSGALFQDNQGITWPHAWIEADFDVGLRLGRGWRLSAGLGFMGLSNSPLASDFSYQAGYFSHAGRLGITWQPDRDSGLCLEAGLGLVTAHHDLTGLYSFYPEARLGAGWYFPLSGTFSGSLPGGFRLDLMTAVQFRQDPGPSWSIGLRTTLPLRLLEAGND